MPDGSSSAASTSYAPSSPALRGPDWTPRTSKTITRRELAARIAKGETLVLHRRRIYKLDRWLHSHPGGELSILHFVGRDATDEIEAYHSDEALRRMGAFVVGWLDQRDWDGEELGTEKTASRRTGYRPIVPPVQLGYRMGKLDHPDAQIETWRRAKKRREAEANMDSVADKEAVEAVEDVLPTDRPISFPIPVSLLEPPADPPGIDSAREQAISEAYREMHERVKAEGHYTLNPAGYARECLRYATLGVIAFLTLLRGLRGTDGTQSSAWLFVSSFFLGLFWHQLTFTAHDAGHCGITHVHTYDRALGTLIADFVGGLSIGWWCDNHDVHHLVTNHPEHDPDIQHMPFFAISPRFVGTAVDGVDADKEDGTGDSERIVPAIWSSYYRRVLFFDAPARLFLRLQHRLYYVVMSLGRFNLYANSYGFLALKARRDRWWLAEMTGLAFFWYWFGWAVLGSIDGWGMRIAYVLISHIVTSPLHVQIVLSHFARSSADLGLRESFASRQVRTTMDVACPPWLDFVHGGLHMQVTHHLFPRLPRHNLRAVRDAHVRPFAARWGLDYAEYGFVEGNGRVLKTLGAVADQVRIMAMVAEAQAKGELHH